MGTLNFFDSRGNRLEKQFPHSELTITLLEPYYLSQSRNRKYLLHFARKDSIQNNGIFERFSFPVKLSNCLCFSSLATTRNIWRTMESKRSLITMLFRDQLLHKPDGSETGNSSLLGEREQIYVLSTQRG